MCAVGPMTSALAAAPAPQVLDASSGRSGRQGSTCNNWCGMPQVQEVRPMQCGVLWFVHISKNGGSTAWDYLKKNAAPNGWKTADFGAQAYALGGPKRWRWNESDGWRDAQTELRQTVPKLIVHWHTRAEGNGYMMRNHLPQIACEMQAKGCDFQMVTTLRDPVDHVMSEMGNRAMTPSVLHSHVTTFSNSQAKSLLFNDAENWPTVYRRGDAKADTQLITPASSMIKDFAVVGQVEAMGAVLQVLQKTLGFPEPPAGRHLNPSPDKPMKLSDEDESMIRDSTEVDHLLYNTLCSTAPCPSAHVAPDICRGSKYMHQGGGLRKPMAGEDVAELRVMAALQEPNVTSAAWAPALGASASEELKAAGTEAIAQAGVARSALEGVVTTKESIPRAASEAERKELEKKVQYMSTIAEEAEQLAYAAEARAEKVKALIAANPSVGAEPAQAAEDAAAAQSKVAAESFKAAKNAREMLLQLPEEERNVAQIKADGLQAQAETDEKLAYEAEKKAALVAQAAADKLGSSLEQVEVEATLGRGDDQPAPAEDGPVPESTAAALAASLAEEALSAARDLRVLKAAKAPQEDITNAEAVAAEALAQAEAAEKRAYHASTKTGAQLHLEAPPANATVESTPPPTADAAAEVDDMAGVTKFEGRAVQRAKLVAEKRLQKREADDRLNAANQALKTAYAEEIKLSELAKEAKRRADLAAADKAAKLRIAEAAAADEEAATKEVAESDAALKAALDNSAEEKSKTLKLAVQRAVRTKERLKQREKKFEARDKKAAVKKALIKADAGKEVARKEAAVKATLDQQATIINAAVEKARQLEREKNSLEKSAALRSAEAEAKQKFQEMQEESRRLLDRANSEKEAAIKESEDRIHAAAELAREAAKKVRDAAEKPSGIPADTTRKMMIASKSLGDAVAGNESTAEKKCVNASGEPIWCTNSQAMEATLEFVKDAKLPAADPTVTEANATEATANHTKLNITSANETVAKESRAESTAEKKCVNAAGEPIWCTETVANATGQDASSEEGAMKAAVTLAEQALAAAKEVRALRESAAASDSQRKEAEAKAASLAAQAEAAEAKLQALEQVAHGPTAEDASSRVLHPASLEEVARPPARSEVEASPAHNTTVDVPSAALSLSSKTESSDSSAALPAQPLLTQEQQAALAAAAEASITAVKKAEQAQTAKNLADPLRKIHKQTAAAVFKAKDELQSHERDVFHASVKAKQAELEAETLAKAVAMARESAKARNHVAKKRMETAGEVHAEAQVASKEAKSAQEDSRAALAEATQVAVARARGVEDAAAIRRAEKALQSQTSDAEQADLEAQKAEAEAQSLAQAARAARDAMVARTLDAQKHREKHARGRGKHP